MKICGNKICNVCLELVTQNKLECPEELKGQLKIGDFFG